MLHVFLAVYLISISAGMVVITLSLLAYARSQIEAFRHFALLFFAAELLLLCQTLAMYEAVTPEHVFGKALPVISLALTICGNGLLAYMICVIACEVVLLPVSAARMAVHVVLAVAAAALGGTKQIIPQQAFALLNDAGLAGIQVYAIVMIIRRLRSIQHPRLVSLIRSILAVVAISAAALVVQMVGQAAGTAPVFLRDFQLVQVLFYLAMVGVLLYYAVQYLFHAEGPVSDPLPGDLIDRYGISAREKEIITMMVRGYTNKVIGEKLFISTMTVKNHIYHIYQKTGVTNKIQLINLINSPK